MSAFQELFDLIGELARRRRQTAERFFSALGLNHTEARLLTLLEQRGGEGAQDALSSQLPVDRTNTGRALLGLERRGYVVRRKQGEDKRANRVQMTAKGRKTAAEIAKLRKEIAERFFGDLREKEAEEAATLLRRALRAGEAGREVAKPGG
jgi:MarR family transcriptional regulator for hemolysin